METKLGRKFKQMLDNLSLEDFLSQWNEITALGFEGPRFDEILEDTPNEEVTDKDTDNE